MRSAQGFGPFLAVWEVSATKPSLAKAHAH